MRIGSLVRHRLNGEIGIIIEIYESRIIFLHDGKPWRTYKHAVEVLCE